MLGNVIGTSARVAGTAGNSSPQTNSETQPSLEEEKIVKTSDPELKRSSFHFQDPPTKSAQQPTTFRESTPTNEKNQLPNMLDRTIAEFVEWPFGIKPGKVDEVANMFGGRIKTRCPN